MIGQLPGRPLIGVTTSEVRVAEQIRQTPQSDPPRHEMALGLRYLQAIEHAGGIPVVIPPLARPALEPPLDGLAGICLSGGPDIHPSAYGEPAHPELGPTWPDLDRFELALARAADARMLPVLAICRGAQALNVARGGTLLQHVPDRFGDAVGHRQSGYGPSPAHPIRVEPGSALAHALGRTRFDVNSYHHQAVGTVGRGLRAVAWSPDGVVEGIEAPGRAFHVGVQWHAEAMAPAEPHARLFSAFVHAAQRYAAGMVRSDAAA
jgi:putative glutamine amidotransferase